MTGVLYRNTRASRVRFLQVFLWTVTLGAIALTFTESFGGAPGSWAVGAILSPIFGICALGMEYYIRCYVVLLEGAPQGLGLETMSTFGRTRRSVPWADVEISGERRDVITEPEGPLVDNSAAMLRIRGRPSPLIVDTTEDAFDGAALRRLRDQAKT